MDPAVLSELCRQSALSMGRTWPNPSVACVIQSQAGLISGHTEPPGGRHAEIAALDALEQALPGLAEQLRRPSHGSSHAALYVTLEPCSKFGRTPPCTSRILQYPGLSVEFLAYDPTLAGEGERLLRNGGINVAYRPQEAAGAFLGGFLGRAQSGLPRLHLKVAHSGSVVGRRGERLAISGAEGAAFGQLLRLRLDAVVTGPGTVECDRPRLDLRGFKAPEFRRVEGRDLLVDSWLAAPGFAETDRAFQPVRVFVVGRRFSGSEEWLQMQDSISHASGRPYYLFSFMPDLWPAAKALPAPRSRDFAPQFRRALSDLGLNEVLVECGPGLYAALREGLSVSDRLYFIESKEPKSGDVRMDPRAWPSGHSLEAVYESETDILRVIA